MTGQPVKKVSFLAIYAAVYGWTCSYSYPFICTFYCFFMLVEDICSYPVFKKWNLNGIQGKISPL
jgi:hypothetical protein